MKYQLLDTLRCVDGCGKRLELVTEDVETHGADGHNAEIVDGRLRCECGREYPVVGGIPRMLPKDLAENFKSIQKTFSYEWKMYRKGERNWGQDIEYRKGLFMQGMGIDENGLRGKRILDAGCGSGLLAMEMADTFGAEVVALDLAFGIEKAYAINKNPRVSFVQGSVLDMPVQDGYFDFLYCAGVLVALPDTHAGFKAIIPKLKPGGRCFIWVYHPINRKYHPKDYYKLKLYNGIRKHITSRLPIAVQYWLYLALMPGFALKRGLSNLVGKKDDRNYREKMQAMFDMFSPIYQNRHTEEEVIGWFKAAGFSNMVVSDIGPYGFGVRGDLV